MKKFRILNILSIILVCAFLSIFTTKAQASCLTGAFLADKPTKEEIVDFENKYGKKPFMIMVFVDWNNFVDEKVIDDVYSSACILFISWEPWHANLKKGINFDKLLTGKHDAYIRGFASKLRAINKPIFIRFGHEMNGNWYPWSASSIGAKKYIAVYRYTRDIFDEVDADNIKWIFSINSEDVPKENNYMNCYPGDEYVDFIGLDGYNWGNTKPWSRWMSFKEIFEKRYQEIAAHFKKPIIISEFSATSSGGNKSAWIREAMSNIKKMEKIKAFILFNVDKETDWSFPINKESGKELKLQLKDSYFKDKDGLYD